jgi:hypothetical protein
MPLYNMSCPNEGCGYSREYLIRNSDEKVYCPRCESTLERGDVGKPSIRNSNGETSERDSGNGGSDCDGNCDLKSLSIGINLEKRVIETAVAEYSCGTKESIPIVNPERSSSSLHEPCLN